MKKEEKELKELIIMVVVFGVVLSVILNLMTMFIENIHENNFAFDSIAAFGVIAMFIAGYIIGKMENK